MKRVPLLTLVFAVLSAVFFLVLVFFRIPFKPYPLMSVQDALDLLTPLVLIPIYWTLFKNGGAEKPTLAEEIVFMVLAAVWVLGQGMHLSANSINNLSEAFAKKQVIDITGTDIYRLTYFYDEHLSHYLWHFGVIGLTTLLVYREWRSPTKIQTRWWMAILGGIIFGFTQFLIFLEGQTVAMGFPFAIGLTLVILIWGRKTWGQRPILAFFFIAYLLAAVLLTGWGVVYGGFPQLTDVGLM